MLVIGAKFGGWGKSLVSIARVNNPKTIFIFNLSNSINFKFGKTQQILIILLSTFFFESKGHRIHLLLDCQ